MDINWPKWPNALIPAKLIRAIESLSIWKFLTHYGQEDGKTYFEKWDNWYKASLDLGWIDLVIKNMQGSEWLQISEEMKDIIEWIKELCDEDPHAKEKNALGDKLEDREALVEYIGENISYVMWLEERQSDDPIKNVLYYGDTFIGRFSKSSFINIVQANSAGESLNFIFRTIQSLGIWGNNMQTVINYLDSMMMYIWFMQNLPEGELKSLQETMEGIVSQIPNYILDKMRTEIGTLEASLWKIDASIETPEIIEQRKKLIRLKVNLASAVEDMN